MAADPHNTPSPSFLRSALIALAEVALVSLALGMAVGFGMTSLVVVLAGAFVGIAAISVLYLHRHAVSEQAPLDEPPTPVTEPLEDEQAPVVTTIEEPIAQSEPETIEASLSLPERSMSPEPEVVVAPPTTTEIDITPSVTDLDEWDLGENPPSTLDFEGLSKRIVGVSDPIAELKLFVGDIRTREAEKTDPPSPFEQYAARLLVEAGLLKTDLKLPHIYIVRPPASHMFYLRIRDRQLPYLAKVRILALEAALNAIRFSDTYFDDPDARPIEEHYQLLQKLTHSIAAQSPSLADHVPISDDESPDTEWAVRLGLSTAIESFQLPHRLMAEWRVNVADGNVGIQLELPSEAVFPSTRYVEDLGLVATSKEMRRKASSDYALRLALLVANAAFRCSELIKHVWVAGNIQTAKRTDCYLSVDFDRWRFSRLDLSYLGDLTEVYHSFAPTLRYEDGILRPVEQTFRLSERRFCPPRRYEPVALSTRKIAKPYADALGTERVSGLSIDEAGNREYLVASILPRLDDSTEHNVRLIMELAEDDSDPSVRSAAERTVTKLIEGAIGEDPESVGREFLSGDALSQAVERAHELLAAKDPASAERLLAGVLEPLDEAGVYADTPHLEYRFFPNYVERALYNRMFTVDGRLPLLVPRTYFQGHFLLSMARLMQGKAEGAVASARRLVELAPLDARSYAHLTHCLELAGQEDEAVEVLTHLLQVAHDPEGVGIGYYRMAFFQWKAGHTLVAQACYQTALRYFPAYTPLIAMEMGALALQSPGSFHEELSIDEAEQVLRDAGLPLAPTDDMAEAFFECARASLDAEIFPVARNFAWILGAFSGDDIMVGLLRSIEDAPEPEDEQQGGIIRP